MAKEETIDKINQALQSPQRNFSESFDMAINLKGIDLKKPQNRIDLEIVLPSGLGRDIKIAVFAKGETAKQAESAGANLVLPPEEIDALGDDIPRAKTLAEEYDFFIAEAAYMPTIGKKIGIVLGPRGKMPEPLMPEKNIADIINKRKNSIKVRSKDRMTFHLAIGRKDMEPEKIADNAEAVMEHVERALVNGAQNLKSIHVSTTMGPSVRLM